jgi:putative flippase GtrA
VRVGAIGLQHSVPRFALVGCANFLVSLAAFYLCYHYLPLGKVAAVGAEGAVANVLAYFAGMVNSFWWNRSWTFRASGGVMGQVVRFAAVNFVSLALSTLAVFLLVDRLGVPALLVWVPLAGLIVVTNYLGFRHWAFAAPAVSAAPARRA